MFFNQATNIKWTPLLILMLLSCTFFYFHLYDYLSLHALRVYETDAQLWTDTHYITAAIFYILCFVTLIACGIPCGTVFSLLGGFLFGLMAILYIEFSTTFGGFILYLAIRTSIGARVGLESSSWVKKMEHGFQRNAFNYLLTLRLIPVFPCWVSNISAGALNVPIKTFVSATLLGILPATIIYVLAGKSLDKIMTDETVPLTHIVLTPSVLLPLLGLAILSLFPVIYKLIKNRTEL